MKKTLLISACLFVLFSCKKDLRFTTDYVSIVKTALKDSVSATDFASLDFSRGATIRIDSIGLYYVRVPFKGKAPNEDFVLMVTNNEGLIKRGKIVHLNGQINTIDDTGRKVVSWEGLVSIASLDRQSVFESSIRKGYFTAFQQQDRYRTATQEPQGAMMPEVIITYFRPSGGGDLSWSSWFSLHSLMSASANGEGGGGNNRGYYSDFSGGGSSSGGGGLGNGGGSIGNTTGDPVILVDSETQNLRNGIDIEKYIACFNAIPDAGSSCSIELFADIPVDTDPNKVFNFQSQSPGHTFIQIKKTNATQIVVQNIGFYPKSDWKSILTNAPIEGKFVDNGEHEFNISFLMSLTPAQLQSVLTELLYLRNVKYDIDNYNCTDWALDVFNKVRTEKLNIPLYDIPGNVPSLGTRTPNGVYNKLRQLKTSGHPEAAYISYNFSKGFVARSTGLCN